MYCQRERVLVLGSSGLIGSALVKALREKGVEVEEYDIKNGGHQDLTNPGWNKDLQASMWKADFVYFLAWDVGGSKYLGNRDKTFDFVHNNMKIMVNVFDALSLCKTPFIFSSSMMTKMSWSTYGDLKRLGEAYTFATAGCNIRFWNVYGKEAYSEKSHVVTDFCHQAATTGQIKMLTRGDEQRQFIHVDDAVGALEALRENWGSMQYSSRPADFDISCGQWLSVRTIAKLVSSEFDGCRIIVGSGGDGVQMAGKPEPDLKYIKGYPYFWQPIIPIKVGIKMIAEEFKRDAPNQR